jgi:plastocyanin
MSTPFKFLIAGVFVIASGALAAAAPAQDSVIEIRFDNHRFAPQTLTVPAGQPLTIKVVNSSKETIEFESFKLNREKAIEPGETITVRLPALSLGSYDFYDDFHQDVPQGSIIAK